eukprot:TRINITY_DN12402_c0_g1_i1.p1 TRINITY_DN12402_c0_g1~~TRINITY_DN12402_c0_g1_i1.p1  ORF type:complete len:157 (+),score=23.77 TRINITY_DN12402_c0_g1_i1:77-547(+)
MNAIPLTMHGELGSNGWTVDGDERLSYSHAFGGDMRGVWHRTIRRGEGESEAAGEDGEVVWEQQFSSPFDIEGESRRWCFRGRVYFEKWWDGVEEDGERWMLDPALEQRMLLWFQVVLHAMSWPLSEEHAHRLHTHVGFGHIHPELVSRLFSTKTK